jgi:hypothetical protein
MRLYKENIMLELDNQMDNDKNGGWDISTYEMMRRRWTRWRRIGKHHHGRVQLL